jgi:UDP-glucose 4-epimerase
MRYLITGGAGFIGSHMAEAMLARGDTVAVLDDFSTGRRSNLAAVASHPSLTIVEGSVVNSALVTALVGEADHVVHLAAAVGVRKIMAERVQGIRTNVEGSETVLAACAKHGRPLFFASTSEVYGKNAKVPFSEDDDSVLGASSLHRWSYACAKLLDEFLALAWFHEHKLPVTVARFFNVTGPRQCPDYGMVLPRFCAAALSGNNLEVHGTGLQSRCFLHVDDCVRAVLALVDTPVAVGKVVNIGSDEEISIRALAEKVLEISGSAAKIHAVPYAAAFPEGGFEDMLRRVPDTRRLSRLTGWERKIDLAQTIRDALRWAREV